VIGELEVVVNEPFQAGLIKHLFTNKEDLKLASPKSKYPFCEDEWEALFAHDPENSSLLFKLRDEVIGHIAFLPKDTDLYLCYVILLPEYRGMAIAEKMMTEAEEFCRLNYPHHELYLNVKKDNLRAIKLYIKLGYATYAEQDENFKMKKKLRHF
jgi:ribosomal protein S18 acetylase RimI-like enzyme